MHPDLKAHEAVIGLEIHVQLNAATKLFCDCPNPAHRKGPSAALGSARDAATTSRSVSRPEPLPALHPGPSCAPETSGAGTASSSTFSQPPPEGHHLADFAALGSVRDVQEDPAGEAPNRLTCPVCLGLPGALPRPSAEAVEKAALACMALHCTLAQESAFDQKVYYYPDLPKGFQLSQHHKPLAVGGWVEIAGEDAGPRRLRIHHVHMEEDVARLVHAREGRNPVSLVDFNRAGVPLIEIVTEPDMRSPYEAMEFVKALRTLLRYTGSSDCSMEQGTMRVDANISLRAPGSGAMNTKVEVKNMNSVRNVGDAVAYEIARQAECLDRGEPVTLHTRLWDPDQRVTTAMREKFSGPCVPDPSVPVIRMDEAWAARIRQRLPEMPGPKAQRFAASYGLAVEEASDLSRERDAAEFFEAAVGCGAAPRQTATWITGHLTGMLRDRNQALGETLLTPGRFAGLLALLDTERIHAGAAREVLLRMLDREGPPDAIVAAGGLEQVSDAAELEALVDRIVASRPDDVADYRKGNAKVIGFLMGLAMKASQGKANPRRLKELLAERLRRP